MDQDRIITDDSNSALYPDTQQVETRFISSKVTAVSNGIRARLAYFIRTEIGNIDLRLLLANFVLQFFPHMNFSRFRTIVYRFCGVRIGYGTVVVGTLSLSGVGPICKRLKVGQRCLINAPLYLDLNDEITIGDGVSIGHHVVLITTDHKIGPPSHRCGPSVFKSISIGDGCWIGARTTILPGVQIGAGAVVGAGALVTKDVAPNTLVVGVPARAIRTLDADLYFEDL